MAYAVPGYMPVGEDPTNVIGPRIGAFFIDHVLFWGIGIVLTLATSHTTTVYGYSVSCQTSNPCYHSTRSASPGVFVLLALISLANLVVLQGVTGASIGKHLVGLRVVTAEGGLCGVGRAFVRWIVGIVDALFCYLVGLITMLATHPHRRVGDMAAGTYVVATRSVGRPIPGAAPLMPYAYGPYVPPPPGAAPPAAGAWGAPPPPPPGAYGAAPSWGAPPPPAPPPAPAPSWGAPAPAQPAPAGHPPAGQPPVAPPPPSSAPPAPPSWGAPPSAAPPAAAPPVTPPASAPSPPPAAPSDQNAEWWNKPVTPAQEPNDEPNQ